MRRKRRVSSTPVKCMFACAVAHLKESRHTDKLTTRSVRLEWDVLIPCPLIHVVAEMVYGTSVANHDARVSHASPRRSGDRSFITRIQATPIT